MKINNKMKKMVVILYGIENYRIKNMVDIYMNLILQTMIIMKILKI